MGPGSFFYIETVSKNLLKPENKPILDSIKKGFNVPFSNKIDPTLAFILETYYSKKEIKNDSLVDLELSYTPRWFTKADTFPGYYIKQSDSTYIVFYGHNMNSTVVEVFPDFKQTVKDTNLKAFNHGVLLKEAGKYGWVFINDNKIFDAPEKLRWPTMEDAKRYGHVAVILNFGYVFISNPDVGKSIRLHFEKMGEDSSEPEVDIVQKIEISNNQLKVTLSEKTKTFNLDDIMKRYFL